MRWAAELVLTVLPVAWRQRASEYRFTSWKEVEFLNHDWQARFVRFWWRYLAVENGEEYRDQVIELRQVPDSKRAWEAMIYWDHDRRPCPVSHCRNYRQAKRYAKSLVDLVLDGVSLADQIPAMLAEMGQDVEIRQLEDGAWRWELELNEEQADDC